MMKSILLLTILVLAQSVQAESLIGCWSFSPAAASGLKNFTISIGPSASAKRPVYPATLTSTNLRDETQPEINAACYPVGSASATGVSDLECRVVPDSGELYITLSGGEAKVRIEDLNMNAADSEGVDPSLIDEGFNGLHLKNKNWTTRAKCSHGGGGGFGGVLKGFFRRPGGSLEQSSSQAGTTR